MEIGEPDFRVIAIEFQEGMVAITVQHRVALAGTLPVSKFATYQIPVSGLKNYADLFEEATIAGSTILGLWDSGPKRVADLGDDDEDTDSIQLGD